MFKSFGSTREVFANQDEGMFIALPMTLDANALSLETEVRNGRTYVLAGSLVKEGATIRGITAEEYDITYGPVVGRVVLEGYAWASRLTALALAAVASLPKIVVLPYKFGVIKVAGIDGLKVILETTEGIKFASDIALSDITAETLTPTSVTYLADGTVAVTFGAAGTGSITAIDATALVNATGATIKGYPIDLTLVAGTKRTVTVTAGDNGTATADKATAAEGEIVTITATPDATYKVDKVLVNGVELAAVEGVYSFVMPAAAVAVGVTFVLTEE